MRKFTVIFIIILLISVGCNDDKDQDDAITDNLAGNWAGSINVPNQPLNILVDFERDDEWKGTISIPVQGLKDYPLSSITIDSESISFLMKIQGQLITFDGELDDTAIKGTFKQSGQSFPFELTKSEDVAMNTEEDEGDFLRVQTDQETLYGELEAPQEDGPFPVMLIIPGSGPTDRDGNSVAMQGKNDSLKLLAEYLAKRGIASVRYDKRGTGKNVEAAIPEEDLLFEQFTNDASAWIDLLKQNKNFSTIGIIGHSQGSLVGMLAAQESGIDVFVSLAGAGHPIDEVLYDQLDAQLPEDLLQESQDVLEQLTKGERVEEVSQELQNIFRPSTQEFLSSWMQYDPSIEIGKIEAPTLIVNGENDLQVPVSEANKLHVAKNDAELLLIQRMNHVLKDAPEEREGNMQTYGEPERPLAEGLVDGIVEFIKVSE